MKATDLVTCPTCKSHVERGRIVGECQPVELDEDDIPYAAAISEGYGLPIYQVLGSTIKCDGEVIKRCVAYDRRAGIVWFHACKSDGQPIIQDEEIVVDQRRGKVTVEWADRD